MTLRRRGIRPDPLDNVIPPASASLGRAGASYLRGKYLLAGVTEAAHVGLENYNFIDDATPTKIPLDSSHFDTWADDTFSNELMSETSFGDSNLVIRNGGVYRIAGTIRYERGSAGGVRLAYLMLNDEIVIAVSPGPLPGYDDYDTICRAEVTRMFLTGDKVSLWGYQCSGSSVRILAIGEDTVFPVQPIGCTSLVGYWVANAISAAPGESGGVGAPPEGACPPAPGGGGGGSHDLFSATHPDVDAGDTPVDGDLLTFDATAGKWVAAPAPSGSPHDHVINETPSGTVDGANDTFTIVASPVAGSVQVWKNGLLQRPGAGNDYTISGSTVTFLAGNIPQTGDVLLAAYET